MTATKKTLDDLRAPFPAAVVGLLPKPFKRDAAKSDCKVCGTYHGQPAVHLDFVGHAAVTDRLLTVDPAWTWEPVALDDRGLPAYDNAGGLWIRLTVLGVTRLGYGDGPDPKQRIGDAIRNAAMRFGVALDLWTKGELESNDPNGGGDVTKAPPASSHGGDVYQHERPADRVKGNPAEQTPWTEPVTPPARATDSKRLNLWREQVITCTSETQAHVYEKALKAMWDDRALTQEDKDDAKALLAEVAADIREADLHKAAEQDNDSQAIAEAS